VFNFTCARVCVCARALVCVGVFMCVCGWMVERKVVFCSVISAVSVSSKNCFERFYEFMYSGVL